MSPLPVAGYVLAGGRSSRMGRDKALLELAGRPLISRAVETLAAVCDSIQILSAIPALETYGRLVPDLHPGCGPLAGVESALLDATAEWSLLLAVDMPFVEAAPLREWVREIVGMPGARVALFLAEGRPQPVLCLLHREVAIFVQEAIAQGELKLFAVLNSAAKALAGRMGLPVEQVMVLREAPNAGWFVNLNTPEEFLAAEDRLRRYQTGS